MYFQGIFIATLSFSVTILCQPLIYQAEYRFTHRIWPALLGLGILFLLFALFVSWLYLSVVLCTAALTFLYGAYRLQNHFNARCRRSSKR